MLFEILFLILYRIYLEACDEEGYTFEVAATELMNMEGHVSETL